MVVVYGASLRAAPRAASQAVSAAAMAVASDANILVAPSGLRRMVTALSTPRRSLRSIYSSSKHCRLRCSSNNLCVLEFEGVVD